jgi:hypothetical protein
MNSQTLIQKQLKNGKINVMYPSSTSLMGGREREREREKKKKEKKEREKNITHPESTKLPYYLLLNRIHMRKISKFV